MTEQTTEIDVLPPYKEGSYSDMNTGRACWSCRGLRNHERSPNCIYPDSHYAIRPEKEA